MKVQEKRVQEMTQVGHTLDETGKVPIVDCVSLAAGLIFKTYAQHPVLFQGGVFLRV